MTLPFAGLARARARMIGGRLEGEAQKWNQDQEEAQRLFREWATRKQMEQADEAQRYTRERNASLDAERKAERAATLARQNQTDQLDAIQAGGEDAPEMTTAQLLAGLSMMQGGTGSSAAAIKAPRTSTYKAKVGGVDVQAEDMGGPSYATVGGRMFRFDRQKGANAAARQRAEKEQFNIADDNRRLQQTLQAIGARSAVDAQQQRAPAVVTQGERQGTALYQFAEPAAQRVLKRYANGFEASGTDKFAEAGKAMGPDMLFNWMQSDEGQQMYDDLTSVVLATQYGLSGKAVTEAEARRLARNLMPAVGDKPGRRAQKILEVNNRMRILRTMAGRGVDPNAPTTLPETMDDLRAKRPEDIP